MTVSATETDANPEVVRPRNLWLRLLAVTFTLLIPVGIGMMAVGFAGRLGIDPKDLQGPRSGGSFKTVTLVLAIYALEALVIFAAQRFIHRRPFPDLGFRAPALRHLVIGFAAGLAVWMSPLMVGLMTGSVTLEWNVPVGVSALTILGFYCLFLVLLTGNSFIEELVYRCYPIEQFRDRPTMMMVAIAVSMLVFSPAHFVIGDFSYGWLLFLLVNAALLSIVYVYYRSIWLLVGLHNASNFLPFTFGGNWKMGGLFTLSGESTSCIVGGLGPIAPVLLILLFYRFRPRREAGHPER